MSINMRRPVKSESAVGLAALLITLVVAFQNCSEPVPVEEDVDQSSQSDGVPFAYDTKIDTFAYMSCPSDRISDNRRSHFSVRVGSYALGSGVKLSSDFISHTSTYSARERYELLQTSSKNFDTFLQLAVRETGNYGKYSFSGTHAEGQSFDNILAALSKPRLGEKLAALGPSRRIGYFSGISGLNSKMVEGSLYFAGNSVSASNFRKSVKDGGGNYQVTLGYGNESYEDEVLPVAPVADSADKIYGVGYKLNFSRGVMQGGSFVQDSAGSPRRLSGLQELNLETGSPVASSWNCSSARSFMVVRPTDLGISYGRGQALCVKNADETTSEVRALRRVLRAEDWFVDAQHNCVVPKTSFDSCYEGTSSDSIVNYSGQIEGVGASCGEGVVTTIDSTTYKVLCPEYVTVCTR